MVNLNSEFLTTLTNNTSQNLYDKPPTISRCIGLFTEITNRNAVVVPPFCRNRAAMGLHRGVPSPSRADLD